MKQFIILIFLLAIGISGFSQHEADIWYFGQFAGIDFRSGSPIALTDGAMSQNEGCASISDKQGNLLFYTNGMKVWNKNHQIMKNGSGLLGHSSASQSGIIVPKPEQDSIYYIFTVPFEINQDGLRYSVVDMSLENGLGAITSEKNIFLISTTEEKITAVKHKNGIDIWVITHLWNSSDFYSYLVTKDGIHEPVISTIGSYHEGVGGTAHGYMKASPDGKKIALNIRKISSLELFDFDKETGIIDNPLTFPSYSGLLYGIEFSPDNLILYVSQYNDGAHIFQFDLSSNDFETIINSKKTIGSVSNQHLGALQLAPDNKIYVSKHDNLIGDSYLGVINSPNKLDLNCNFVEDGFYLEGKKCIWGLPNFIQSYFDADFTYNPDCYGDSTWFDLQYSDAIDSSRWDFGDPLSGSDNISYANNPFHIFSSSGTFLVKVIIFGGDSEIILEKNVIILPTPYVDLGEDITLCSQTSILLNANNGFNSYLWQDDSSDSVFLVSQPGDYWVRVENKCGFASDTIHIEFSESFDINLGNDTSFCYGQSIILSPGSNYYSYYWQDGSNDTSIIANLSGYYWVQVTDSVGCTASDSIYIDAFMDFNFSLGADTSVICEGDYIFLHGQEGYDFYEWQDGSEFPDFIADTAGIYWLEITDYNNCAARDSILLIVNIIPDNFLGNDTVMCEDSFFDIHAPSYYDNYLWQDGSTDSVYIAWQTGDYWVFVEDSIGCSGIDTISLSLFQPPLLNHTYDTLICPGDTLLLNLGGEMLYYLWSNGSTDSSIIIYENGEYWVESGSNCGLFRDSINVDFYSNPNFTLGADTNICSGEVIKLSVGNGFVNYLWNDGSSDSLLFINEQGTYSVTVNDGRCLITDSIIVDRCSLLWVPNVFTPNGDSYNDYFFAIGEHVQDFKMTIFNRWGQILKTLYNIDEKWDGYYNGSRCSEGVYYWVAEFVEIDRDTNSFKKVLKGSVTLIRNE